MQIGWFWVDEGTNSRNVGRDEDTHLLLSRIVASYLMIKVSRHGSKSRYITTSIFKVHTPTNIAQKEAKDVFYEQVQKILDKIPMHDIVTLMVDWNA